MLDLDIQRLPHNRDLQYTCINQYKLQVRGKKDSKSESTRTTIEIFPNQTSEIVQVFII